MQQFYTYLHCKPDGAPFYVGKGFGKRSHYARGRSTHHQNTTAKYGWENIQVFVFPCDSEAQALADEVQQIAQLRAEGYELVNQTDGGEGVSGLKQSADSIAKAVAGRRGYKHSLEMRAYMSAKLKGRVMSEEAKIKISKTRKDRGLGHNRKGQKHSAQSKLRMSAAQTGNKNCAGHKNSLGYKFTSEQRAALSVAVTTAWKLRKEHGHE